MNKPLNFLFYIFCASLFIHSNIESSEEALDLNVDEMTDDIQPIQISNEVDPIASEELESKEEGELTQNLNLSATSSNPQFSFTSLTYLGHTEGKGLGYDKGYTTFGGFFIGNFSTEKTFYPFIDIRDHYFNDGKMACNIGIGSRWNQSCLKTIWGLGIYYDCFQGLERQCFNQTGVSFEVLSPFGEVRFNGYFPVGEKERHTHAIKYDLGDGFVAFCRENAQALKGYDVEIGLSLNKFCPASLFDVYFGGGMYSYYRKDEHHTIRGGKFRLSFYIPYIIAEVRGSYDHHFGHVLQGFVAIAFSFGSKLLSCHCIEENLPFSLIMPMKRNEVIVLDKGCCWKTNF